MSAADRWTMSFPPEPRCSSAARYAVREVLAYLRLDPDMQDAIDIVVGELAANSIIHARTEFTVTVRLEEDLLRVELFDSDTRAPLVLGVDADATSGRGLHLVASVADDWGWRTARRQGIRGKAVWAEWRISRVAAICTE